MFARDRGMMDKPQHMARLLSWALADLMLAHPNIIVAGEDVGPKGGVYNVTAKLHERFGSARVINTLLDEQSILGLGIGAAHNGLLADHRDPVPRLRPQCRGPDTRRGGDPELLLERPVYQSDDHPHRRPRLPEGLWRAFPQRQQPRRLPRHSRADPRLPEQRRRCGRDAARMRPARARGAAGDRLRRADRALHDPRPPRRRRRPVDRRPMPRRARRSRSGSARSAAMATAPTSPSSPTATAIISPARPRRSCASGTASTCRVDRPALAGAAERGRPARRGRRLRPGADRRRMPPDRIAERGADGAVRRARAGGRRAPDRGRGQLHSARPGGDPDPAEPRFDRRRGAGLADRQAPDEGEARG